MNRLEIEECNNIDHLRQVAVIQCKTLTYISEVLVDVSKLHITPEKAFDKMRTYLQGCDMETYKLQKGYR